MIEEIYETLACIDTFSGVSRDEIRIDTLQTLAHSEVYRIRIASATSVILKRPGVADISGLADRERRFYRHIAPLLPDGLVPACLLAVDDAKGGWLLIEDLSHTHREIGDLKMPTREQCRGLAMALATLHASTDDRSRIRKKWISVSGDLPAATIDQRLDFCLTALEPFIAIHRDKLDRKIIDFLPELAGIRAELAQASSQQPALVHGDAHLANVLYSKASTAAMIDWAMPMAAFGGIDLAHAVAMNLPRQLARDWESEILGIYRERISACGSPLGADELYERYRLGVLYSLANPVVWWYTGVPESLWLPALVNSIGAASDLDLLT